MGLSWSRMCKQNLVFFLRTALLIFYLMLVGYKSGENFAITGLSMLLKCIQLRWRDKNVVRTTWLQIHDKCENKSVLIKLIVVIAAGIILSTLYHRKKRIM